ncbi:MAG: hypothetical protein ACRCU0_07610 [Candidatus Rhabdochlamydia sp.]
MTSLIKDASLGLVSASIIADFNNLQEFEKGRIHHVHELISRVNLIRSVNCFFDTTLQKNKQHFLSNKVCLATMSIPCTLAFLKSSYASDSINPTMLSMVIRIEKYIGRICYIVSVVNAIALIGLGHLLVGYTALTVFSLDLISSFTLIQTHIPQVDKVRMVFIKYIAPFAALINGIAKRNFITLGISLFGLYYLLSEEHQKMRTRSVKTNLPSITTLEQLNLLWNALHSKPKIRAFVEKILPKQILMPEISFEMNRERVPHIQIPTLDPSKYPPNKILEIFDAINWDRKDFQRLLWNRVTGIAEADPKKVFKNLENAFLKEKEAHHQKELLRAKKMARDWLQAVLQETPRQDLLSFKQHICKMLLEHRNLLEKDKNTQSNLLMKGVLTLIFGSGGECHVAQEMKIKEAFLEIYKACNKEAHDSTFLLMLELAYKSTTEQAFKDILNPILQDVLEKLIVITETSFTIAQTNLAREWTLRSPMRIHLLACAALRYASAKNYVISIKEMQKTFDLTSVHNFTLVAKIFGKDFNIAADIDEVAERAFSNAVMSAKDLAMIESFRPFIPLTLGKFYWDTQLEKIIHPWLTTHFQEQTYFQLNDLTQWFHHLLEGFKTNSNIDQIDHMQEELQKDIPTINGYPLAEYKPNGKNKVLVPTIQSLLVFAYGINLLKIKDPQSQGFFNHIDKKMHIYENKEFDFTNIEKNIQKTKNFIPQNILEKLNRLGQSINKEKLQRDLISLQKLLAYRIDKETLFFA